MSLTRTPYNLPCIFLDFEFVFTDVYHLEDTDGSGAIDPTADGIDLSRPPGPPGPSPSLDYTVPLQSWVRYQSCVESKHLNIGEDTKRSVNKVEMDEEDQRALNKMIRIKTKNGNEWQCTVCKKQNRDKTLIRKHIKRMHV